MKTMKQNLMALLLKQWVTPLDALNKVGCMSLSQRCGEIRKELQWERDELIAYGRTVMALSIPRLHSKWVKLPNGKRVKAYRAIK